MDIFKAISLIALFILLIALLFIHFNNRKVLAELEERRVLDSAKLYLMDHQQLDNELSNWLYALGLPQKLFYQYGAQSTSHFMPFFFSF